MSRRVRGTAPGRVGLLRRAVVATVDDGAGEFGKPQEVAVVVMEPPHLLGWASASQGGVAADGGCDRVADTFVGQCPVQMSFAER